MDRLEGELGAVDAWMECAMTHYRVSYYKNLLSSDGHQFKCLQKQFDLPNVESAKKAEEIAARQFESLHGLHSLRWFADVIEVECANHQQA
jgi:hypothetical protein